MSSSRTFFSLYYVTTPKVWHTQGGNHNSKKAKKKKKNTRIKPRNCTSDFPSPHFFSDDRSCMLSINYSEKWLNFKEIPSKCIHSIQQLWSCFTSLLQSLKSISLFRFQILWLFFFPDNKIINALGKIIILSLINVLHTVFIIFFFYKNIIR